MAGNPIASFLRGLVAWLRRLSGNADAGRIPEPTSSGREPRVPTKVQAQIEIAQAAFGATAATAFSGEGRDEVEFLFRADHVLVATDQVETLSDYLRSRGHSLSDSDESDGELAEGLTLYRLPSSDGPDSDHGTSIFAELESVLPPGTFSPDHVVYVTKGVSALCPATEPEAPDRNLPWPRQSPDTDRGAGVMINVVDTGWWKPASQDPEAPWLAFGVDGDAEQINPAAIHPYGGHGTFVAGVIRCQAPQAEIFVDGMLTKGGAIFESELMRQLDIAVLSDDVPNIVSISGGTHTYNDRPLLTFEYLARKHNLIDNSEAPLIVAAAGNDGSDSPFWPAAFDWVVGVGSLDRDDTVSDYSNHGSWVDIYALGRDHVNAYPTGTYTCYEPPNTGEVRQFTNLAKWSGTSFSTPLITGLIAGLMTEHGLNAREAWLRLKAHAIVRTDAKVGKILTVDTPGD